MVLFGLDISHHQGAFDIARAAREGIDFIILKATEGSGFTDSRFAENLRKARGAKLPVAAYHYQRSGVSAAAQVAHITRVVPKDVPVIPDVEHNSGGVALTRDIVTRLRGRGYRVPLTYLPRWYWQQIGSPPLAGLPPLWSSRYPDNRVGSIASEYAQVPAHYWDGYGGLSVAVLQFTSSARVAGRHPIDANAYRGTKTQLTALLGGEEDDMPLTDADLRKIERIVDQHARHTTRWIDNGDISKPYQGHTLKRVRRELAALRDLVAQHGGLTAEQVTAAVRAAMPDTHELAAAVAAAVDHDLDTAAVEQALRNVLGSLNEEENTNV